MHSLIETKMWIHQIIKPYLCPDNVVSSFYRDGNVDTYLMPGLENVDTSLYTIELGIKYIKYWFKRIYFEIMYMCVQTVENEYIK